MDKQFSIVYIGQLSYGFKESEAREALAKKYRFNDKQLSALFTSDRLTIKKGVSEEQGRSLISSLRECGILCELVPFKAGAKATDPPPPKSSSAPPSPINQQRASRAEVVCPKCETRQPEAEICIQCGVIMEKARRALERLDEGVTPQQLSARIRGEDETRVQQLEQGFWERHPEVLFLCKAALTIAAILFVGTFLPGLIAWFLFFFPLGFLLVIRAKAINEGVSTFSLLREHLTLMPVFYAEGERRREGVAWVTYGLILVNVLIFYFYQLNTDPQFVYNNLCFPPGEPTPHTTVIALVTHMFLHGSGGHLWGNMIMLWVFGTVIEKRIGYGRFSWFYLLSGVLSAVLSLVAYWVMEDVTPGLGASGAIAGVMGLFAVRCYFKSVVFPIPILGVFSLIFPVSLKIRLNSLVLIGLFFLKDLYLGVGQMAGEHQSNVNHWAHLGGTFTGIGLAYLFKLGKEAIEEKHLDQGLKEAKEGRSTAAGEASLRKVLETSPDNVEALSALARMVSRFQPTAEGETFYRKAIALTLSSDKLQAAALFKEYFQHYMKGVEPQMMYRLARIYHSQHDLDMASQTLTLIAESDEASASLKEKVLMQNARILEGVGDDRAARSCYEMLLELFPHSEHVERAQKVLNNA